MLPHMLRHYKNMVDNIYVVVYRQSKDDNIVEEIEELGITPFKVVTEPKYDWHKVTEFYNKLKRTKADEWWIVSDDDELQVYPRNIREIIETCEVMDYKFVTGGFIDRIGPEGTFPEINRDTNVHKAFPYAGFFRYPMSGACPNKVTLMKGYVDVTPGQHYVQFANGTNSWGDKHPDRMPIEECFTQVHHFKWDYSVLQRLKQVSTSTANESFANEYKIMLDAIVDRDYNLDLNNREFMFERVEKQNYNHYRKWKSLTEKILNISGL